MNVDYLDHVAFVLPEYVNAAGVGVMEAVSALMPTHEPMLDRLGPPVKTSEVRNSVVRGKEGEVELEVIEMGSEFATEHRDVLSGFPDSLYEQIDRAAKANAETLVKAMYENVIKITDATGNKIDAGGEPLSHKLILDMLEGMEIGFHDDGTIATEIHMNPEMGRKFQELPPPTPEEDARYNEIIGRAKEKWLARKRARRIS